MVTSLSVITVVTKPSSLTVSRTLRVVDLSVLPIFLQRGGFFKIFRRATDCIAEVQIFFVSFCISAHMRSIMLRVMTVCCWKDRQETDASLTDFSMDNPLRCHLQLVRKNDWSNNGSFSQNTTNHLNRISKDIHKSHGDSRQMIVYVLPCSSRFTVAFAALL